MMQQNLLYVSRACIHWIGLDSCHTRRSVGTGVIQAARNYPSLKTMILIGERIPGLHERFQGAHLEGISRPDDGWGRDTSCRYR